MAVSEIVSGSGIRYGLVMELDADTGYPMPANSSATPYEGIRIEGITTTSTNDPAPNRISFYGDDNTFAQDSLPPGEAESFTFATDKVNFPLAEAISGALTRSYGSEFIAQGKNTNERGNEPLVLAYFYRQALDTDVDSATFGRVRQWHWRMYPAARIVEITPEMNESKSANNYEGTPTSVKETGWGEDFDNTNWGHLRAFHLDGVADQGQPILNTWRGNGTLTGFTLSKSPIDSSHLKVWVNGSLTTPSTVTTGASPSFTLGAAPAQDAFVFAVSMTSDTV